jgi:hypothetical protein
MTKKELLTYLTDRAIEYAPDATKSVFDNKHMNNLSDFDKIDQRVTEALLVDFINFIGLHQGLDWGLYTHYLHDEE